ncbi:hypothetical protein C5C37_01975 [Rathayibacter sp. AY1F9]|nr:hypothetical protein C5C37_01975 [Rathayibacter sp. AY1F9]
MIVRVTPTKRRLRISNVQFVFAIACCLVMLVLALLNGNFQWALLVLAGAAIGIVYNFWSTESAPRAVTDSRSREYSINVPARRLERDRPHAAVVTKGPYSGEYAIISRDDDCWSVIVAPRKLIARRPSAGFYDLSDTALDDLLHDLGAAVIRSGFYADQVLDGFGL